MQRESADQRPPSRVVVLLDGDADFVSDSSMTWTGVGVLSFLDASQFKLSFLRAKDGGRNAAIELHKRVRAWVAEKQGPGSPDPRIVASSGAALSVRLSCTVPDFYGAGAGLASRDTSRGTPSLVVNCSRSCEASTALRSPCRSSIPAPLRSLPTRHDGGYSDTLHRLDERLKKRICFLRTTPCFAQRLVHLNLPEVDFAALFDGRDPRHNGGKLAAGPSPALIEEARLMYLLSAAPPPSALVSVTRTAPTKAVGTTTSGAFSTFFFLRRSLTVQVLFQLRKLRHSGSSSRQDRCAAGTGAYLVHAKQSRRAHHCLCSRLLLPPDPRHLPPPYLSPPRRLLQQVQQLQHSFRPTSLPFSRNCVRRGWASLSVPTSVGSCERSTQSFIRALVAT